MADNYDTLTGHNEEVAERVAKRMLERRRTLMERAGDRPWGADRMSSAQARQAYREVREEPAYWQESLAQERKLLGQGPEVVPRELYEAAVAAEKRHKE